MKKVKYSYILLRANSEYYTFISGALISIPISMLFEFRSYYRELSYWIALVASLLTSFICFKLAIKLKEVQEEYEQNKVGVGTGEDEKGKNAEVWNVVIETHKKECLFLFILTLILFALAVVFVFIMQLHVPIPNV